MNVGHNIRKLRLRKNLTQSEVAQQCDLTKSMISKIENDHVLPAIATLTRIAQTLDVKISDLIGEREDIPTLHTLNPFINLDSFMLTSKGYRIFNPIAAYPAKLMQPMMMYVKHSEHKRHVLTHSGEEYLYVISGEMTFLVGESIYLLRSGDSLYFDSTQKHGIYAVPHEVQYLDIFAGQDFSDPVLR